MSDIDKILNCFREINQVLFKTFYKDAERVGITVPQLLILKMLKTNRDIGIRELSDKLFQSISTVSSTVDRLVQNGLVTRSPSPLDRRAVTLSLTEAGESKLQEAVGEGSFLRQRFDQVRELPVEQIEEIYRVNQLFLQQFQNGDDAEEASSELA